MKNLKKIYAFFACMMFMGCLQLSAANMQSNANLNYQEFYNALSPYGSWINYPGYGNVWHPDVADFRPYATNGNWEYTDEGWFWDSDYEWGWAPFHYGSWTYDDQYGWLWIPGYDWAPAWVTWGEYGDNYAWAPIGPGIDLAVNGWNNWHPGHDYYWNMVPKNAITDRDISRHLVDENRVRGNASGITLMNDFQHNSANHYYAVGPDSRNVAGVTHRDITPVRLSDTDRQGAMRINNAAGMNTNNPNPIRPVYRPQVTRPDVSHTQTVPVRSVNENSIRPLHGNSDWPEGDFNRQRTNIENLPTRQAPMHDFGPAGGMRGGDMHPQSGMGDMHGGGHR